MSLGLSSTRSATGRQITGRILENATAPTNGEWYPIDGEGPVSVTVAGDFEGELNIRIDNKADGKPDATNTQPVLGDTLTGAGYLYVEGRFRWIKAELAAIVSGTVTEVNILVGTP